MLLFRSGASASTSRNTSDHNSRTCNSCISQVPALTFAEAIATEPLKDDADCVPDPTAGRENAMKTPKPPRRDSA
eukprot:12737070-Alexandrium_andersonii.AAC.1